MTISSPAFADSAKIPDSSRSAQPTNVSPALQWGDAPAGTVSFTLILHDLDPRPARGVDVFTHWLLWNIRRPTTHLNEAASAMAEAPDGTRQIVTAAAIGGPASAIAVRVPPAGPAHHYVFEIFALDIKLTVLPAGTRADVMKAMDGHVLGHGVLLGCSANKWRWRPAPVSAFTGSSPPSVRAGWRGLPREGHAPRPRRRDQDSPSHLAF